MATMRQLQGAFNRAERLRVIAARSYYAAYQQYQRLRSPQRRFDFYYQTLLPASERANRATDRRNLAYRALEQARHIPEPDLLPAGTEFEFTAVTEGGTPGKGK